MKLALGVVLVCLFTFLGYVLSGKFTLRKSFYTNFYNFNNKLKQEINFRQTTLVSLLNDNESNDFFCAIKNYIQNNKFDFNKSYLKRDEIDFFYNYLKTIGSGDKDSQIEYLKEINSIVVEKKKQSIEDEKRYKTLYVKLGFLFGLIVLILIL